MLWDRIPGAGHLVHMPSHIDLRLGNYDKAIQANQRAIHASMPYADSQNFFTIYRVRNYHFLSFAAMFEGRKQLAMDAARGAVAQMDMEFVRAVPDFLDAFLGVPIHVMVRFAMWNEVLFSEPAPAGRYANGDASLLARRAPCTEMALRKRKRSYLKQQHSL